jgi:hypothetical protein
VASFSISLNRRAALKATAVTAGFIAFMVCMAIWPVTTGAVALICIGGIFLFLMWGVAYESFRKRSE